MREINGRRICIICEGFEEQEYLESLLNKAVFSNKYDFKLINVKSQNNIIPIYQSAIQSSSYYIVLIFCDTDKGPSDKYKEIKQKINEFHDNDLADDIIIFGNPCTMQIILSHFGELKLISQSKATNSDVIEQYTGITNYKATKEQREKLFGKINRKNYETMKTNIKKLSINDEEISSTNILKFIEYFESEDDGWIDKIDKKL